MSPLKCKPILYCALVLGLSARTNAAEPGNLQPIGAVARFERTGSGILLRCADDSAVAITVLAADLIRVRAAFREPLPVRDHSWAIANPSWAAVPWQFEEN